jgi:hypothetical protein
MGTKNQTSFKEETAKKASKKSHEGTAARKRATTNKIQNRVKYDKQIAPDLQDYIRQALTAPDGKGHIFYEQFIDTFLADAKADPNGKCGQLLASSMFSSELLSKLDAETEKAMARDQAFSRYRLHSTLFKEQKQVIEDTASKNICIICSRRAGKTEEAARSLVDTCIEPKSPTCYINLTFANAVNQLFDLCTDSANLIGLNIVRSSKSDGYIEFANGSSIMFRGNSNVAEREKIRGYKFKKVIIDEIQSQNGVKYLIDDILTPAMGDYENSQLIVQGTPPRIKGTFVEDAYTTENNGWTKYHWTAAQNPFMPNWETTLDDICRRKGLTRDDPFIQREFMGIIAYDTEAMVYKDYKTYEGEIPRTFVPTNIVIGVDFGFSDNNAVITLAYNKDTKKAYVTEERKFNHSSVSEIVNVVRESVEHAKKFLLEYNNKGADFNNIMIVTDTNEKSIAFELNQTYGLPAYCAYKYDKDYGISKLAEWCRTATILVPKGGVMEDEFEKTVYKRDDNDNITTEIDDQQFHPDAADALLYASRQMAYDFGDDSGGQAKAV